MGDALERGWKRSCSIPGGPAREGDSDWGWKQVGWDLPCTVMCGLGAADRCGLVWYEAGEDVSIA